MSDGNAFDRQLEREIDFLAGPEPRVDVREIGVVRAQPQETLLDHALVVLDQEPGRVLESERPGPELGHRAAERLASHGLSESRANGRRLIG